MYSATIACDDDDDDDNGHKLRFYWDHHHIESVKSDIQSNIFNYKLLFFFVVVVVVVVVVILLMFIMVLIIWSWSSSFIHVQFLAIVKKNIAVVVVCAIFISQKIKTKTFHLCSMCVCIYVCRFMCCVCINACFMIIWFDLKKNGYHMICAKCF